MLVLVCVYHSEQWLMAKHSQPLSTLLLFHSNNGHMIKFQLFDTAQSYQCHFAEISTFVVSIAHYMRAYFNYMALTQGQDFSLPADAAYLNVGTTAVDNGSLSTDN